MQTETLREMFESRLRNAPPPEWLQQMQRDYLRTGTVRPEDLRRLLGDPLRCVESGPKPSLASFLGQ
jgi:hypothetical protein